jgi:hypothetical protein
MIRALALNLLASCAAATPTITRDLGGVANDYMVAVDRMIASVTHFWAHNLPLVKSLPVNMIEGA